jgi:hypothetical protein
MQTCSECGSDNYYTVSGQFFEFERNNYYFEGRTRCQRAPLRIHSGSVSSGTRDRSRPELETRRVLKRNPLG